MIIETALYLGPAEVITQSERPGFIDVKFPDGETSWARLALAMHYQPAVGDQVLVIRQEADSAYVIGVLQGRGSTILCVPGDLNLEAPNGAVRISAGTSLHFRGGESMEVTAPRTTIRTSRLNLLATTLVQRVNSAYTWATGLLQTKCRRLRQVSDEGWLVRAGRGHLKTDEGISINGKNIHLG
jgi:hypothetical protein